MSILKSSNQKVSIFCPIEAQDCDLILLILYPLFRASPQDSDLILLNFFTQTKNQGASLRFDTLDTLDTMFFS
jgi:hypothetical protein